MTRLTSKFVRGVTKPGRYTDQDGLMLVVKPTGAKSWVQRIVIQGVRRDFGLGSARFVTLAEARDMAFDNRRIARRGGDPLADRRKPKTTVPTFSAALVEVIKLNQSVWKAGSKTASCWQSTMEQYAYPVIGDVRVSEITSAQVLAILAPLWIEKRATGDKIKARISGVMQWSMAQGYRSDDPAGPMLNATLPKGKATTQAHMRALPYSEVAGAIRAIREADAWPGAKLAFEFLIKTACRSGEVRGAAWSEIDLDSRLWTIPASRMKTGAEHRVPLSDRAMEVLVEARQYADGSGLVFLTQRGKPLYDAAISKICRDCGIAAVPHGFRSSFRDWASEQTDADHAVIEKSLAHNVGSDVERAYARSDLLNRRRKLMEMWDNYTEKRVS